MSDLSAPLALPSFGTDLTVAVIGATGGIGGAFLADLAACPAVKTLFALSRSVPAPVNPAAHWLPLDLEDEDSIAAAAATVKEQAGAPLDLVIVATGILHGPDGLRPEKTWRAMEGVQMERVFRLNTIGPALVAKHFLPLLAKDRKAVFAALSARVGSIEDNQLGGWHAYRASKAALNMIIRNLAIELARKSPEALCVGLHPGTTDTDLSKPFQSGVPEGKLFPPAKSARHMLTVLDGLTPADTGQVFAWDGARIPF